MLPDGSRWLVDLWGSAADMALSGPPYAWRKGLSRRPNSSAKWLIPLVAYGQVRAATSWCAAGASGAARARVWVWTLTVHAG